MESSTGSKMESNTSVNNGPYTSLSRPWSFFAPYRSFLLLKEYNKEAKETLLNKATFSSAHSMSSSSPPSITRNNSISTDKTRTRNDRRDETCTTSTSSKKVGEDLSSAEKINLSAEKIQEYMA